MFVGDRYENENPELSFRAPHLGVIGGPKIGATFRILGDGNAVGVQ